MVLVRSALTLITVVAACLFVTVPSAGPAGADPGEDIAADLHRQLEAASRGYLDAEAKLAGSRQRQADLAGKLTAAEAKVAAAQPQANEILAATYRTGGTASTASMLLGSGSAGGFVDRAASLRVVAARNERMLRELIELRRRVATAKAAIDAEVKLQEQQLATMAKKKADAERALASYGGGADEGPTAPAQPPPAAGGGSSGGGGGKPPPAQPPPGNGSFPAERCSVDDPTTNGCITPRTLHALRQAQAAGFTRFVSCYRS